MKKPGDQDEHEVYVDAVSGEVLKVQIEPASDEQKEHHDGESDASKDD